MLTLGLIDGDIVAYRAACALQETIGWGDGVTSATADPDRAATAAISLVKAWALLAKVRYVRLAFTGKGNFRKTVLPTYKANRAGNVKPIAYRHVVEALSDQFRSDIINGLEADDILGILATTPRYAQSSVIMSVDKDMATIPAWHMNPLKDSEPMQITEEDAGRRWMTQTLVGDAIDGYSGCPGIGRVKAAHILNCPPGAYWGAVTTAFRNAGKTEQDAITMARVARILRREDYDRETKEVVLWHPRVPERLKLEGVRA